MNPEQSPIPDWDRLEREADLEWINENLDIFRFTATDAFEKAGRGVLVVDATALPDPDEDVPVAYYTQEQVEAYGDEDINRMMGEYDPDQELVVVLLKPEDRTSTYRVRAIPAESEKKGFSKLQPPDIETLLAWDEEGGCEAACPYGCWVEPDGTCEHGNPNWLIVMGLI